ncbi:1,3-beta-galactosyl-N-acetylhexosamine phosphorylase [Actinotalea sp. C106]|uniref:1,3-beta-galactosyl-N-acetylhexosamine phosphorylase n=1 Tax=Actinotalea sp. C106 TaxID=2908644 RepID=UPI00202954E5|nr:1,3-beta-galactosyl-N-acetylhexosamine phosphorylase [Actinotalea sp. C106]
MTTTAGGFTLPGEAGHEDLTLALAERWGADVIRDSDGTSLSREILDSGHGIYSTLCLIREDNDWAKANPDKLQQNFLMTTPVTATGPEVTIELLAGYSRDQFVVNDWDGLEFWQVFDRTTGLEVPRERWELVEGGRVVVRHVEPWHSYTVNFLVTRIWEEISMYNHVTNDWGDREHLRAVEPRHPEVREHLLAWLEQWCVDHPDTTVVRFTSLFYNFAWFWGDDPALPHVYADWGSYDFTVNPIALREFTATTGRTITAEDFVNAGRYTSTHNPPSDVYRAWMTFTQDFVLELGKACVDVVHRHGKKAYVFYDDSWVGLEPYSGRFTEYGFDGLIKAVFSGYEARLCAGAEVPTHELRLHPYLFPIDLEGKPTFAEGGDPTSDARAYWTTLRRALLRAPIDRIGLGGYLSLTEPFGDFQDYIAQVADEHRLIRQLHADGAPHTSPVRVGVLTAWGSLRTWTTSGHLHENPELTLLHVLESLAGLPLQVTFHSLAEVAAGGVPDDVDVLINAGDAGSAWSGGEAWADPALVTAVTAFVARGGGLVGLGQPSATAHSTRFFQLADVLGVDQDTGDRIRLMRRTFDLAEGHAVLAHGADDGGLGLQPGVFLTRSDVTVLAADGGTPVATAASFGEGRAVYLADHRHGAGATRRLENAILWAAGAERTGWWSADPRAEVAAFPASGRLVVVSTTDEAITTTVHGGTDREVDLEPGGMVVLEM